VIFNLSMLALLAGLAAALVGLQAGRVSVMVRP